MTNYVQTIAEFWGQFLDILHAPPLRIPAFQTGYAVIRDAQGRPAPPPFPYITYDLVRPAFGQSVLANVSIWDRRIGNPGWFNLVNHVLGQIEAAIPHGGVVLRLNDNSGAVWLQRGTGNFISYLDDPDDQLITRGIVSLVVRGLAI